MLKNQSSNIPVVEINQLKKSYQLGSVSVPALKSLDLSLKKGEFTALIGASGSGKTTLLNLIGCLDDADSGSVFIDGIDVAKLSDDQKSELRNKKIGFIFQSFNLVPVLSVFENVELPLVIQKNLNFQTRKDRVERALQDVGLFDFRNHRPDQLSGGQRQRVAIARALVTEPALILADEPTANLDSQTAHYIIDLLLELNQKRNVTFFFCTHDEKLMSRVQRIVKIKDGILSE